MLDSLATWFHRWIVPYPHERTPVSFANAPVLVAAFFPLLLMAYLARRPNTWLLRVLVLPLAVLAATRVFFGYYFTAPGANEYNWALGLLAIYCSGKALELAAVPRGRLKMGEKTPGEMRTPAHLLPSFLRAFPGLYDAVELLCAVRGIGWDFGTGTGLYVPAHTRPMERPAWIRATLVSFLASYCVFDVLEAVVKLFPGVNTPSGGSIFYPDLPPLQRYAVSTLIHSCTGFACVAGFAMCYDLVSLCAVVGLGHEPISWPPCWEAPWSATSLHDFWARRWHQFMRQCFLTLGGYPLAALGFGRAGIVLGCFAASALFHDLSMYAMARGFDARVFFFFCGQGLLVLSEHFFRKLTGRRVSGWPGRLWVYFAIFVLGQPLVDSWHRRGLGGGLMIPPPLSPARQIVFPLIRAALARL